VLFVVFVEGDSVAWHCIGSCCLFVSVFWLTCCTCRGFSVVEHLGFVSGLSEWRVWTDCGKCALELCSP